MVEATCRAAMMALTVLALAACDGPPGTSGAPSGSFGPEEALAYQGATTVTPAAPSRSATPASALLPSEEKLEADTVVAARYAGSSAGLMLLGVWATTAPECGLIDQDEVTSFAVVTPSSFRDAESRCTVALVASDATAEVSGTCIGGGGSHEREILLESVGPDRMRYRPQPDHQAVNLLRCRLPQ